MLTPSILNSCRRKTKAGKNLFVFLLLWFSWLNGLLPSIAIIRRLAIQNLIRMQLARHHLHISMKSVFSCALLLILFLGKRKK